VATGSLRLTRALHLGENNFVVTSIDSDQLFFVIYDGSLNEINSVDVSGAVDVSYFG